MPSLINRSIDVKLNVRMVFVGLIHEYAYEGPCRFGPWETLTKEFDEMHQPEIFKNWSTGVGQALASVPGINILEPTFVKISDEFFAEESEYKKLEDSMADIDLYLFTGMRCEGFVKEFAMRYKKPVACMGMFASTISHATLSSRGYESYAVLDIPDTIQLLKALRTRKALAQTKVLAVTRNNSQYSVGSQDALLSNDTATKRLGVSFNYFSVHEYLDMLNVNGHGENHTLPGRKVYNLNDDDMAEINSIVDDIIKDADDVTIDRKFILNSVKATILSKKLMSHFQCNAFTAPCPEACATRRMNQEQFTYCFTHSLLNEQGIPSACEFDLIGALSMTVMANISGKAPYQGNTQPCIYHNGKVESDFVGIGYIPEMDNNPNIYYTGHATPNRLMHGFDKSPTQFAVRPFTHSGWGATMRIDFNKNKGEPITLMRFNPACDKIMVARGTCVGGFGFDTTGCSEGLYFEVENKHDYFHKQSEFGLHMPMVFGDHVEDIKMLGKVLNMEVVIA